MAGARQILDLQLPALGTDHQNFGVGPAVKTPIKKYLPRSKGRAGWSRGALSRAWRSHRRHARRWGSSKGTRQRQMFQQVPSRHQAGLQSAARGIRVTARQDAGGISGGG